MEALWGAMTVFQDHFRNVPTEEFLQPNPHTTMLLSPFGYTIVSRIYTPFTYKPPLHFQPKFLHRYFYLTYRHPNQWPFYQNNVPTPSSSRSLWQRKNEASIHRTAKEFAVHRSQACSRVVSISNTTLKGKTRGMLGKCRCLRGGQPLSVDLYHRVSEVWGTTELVVRADRQLLSVCNIMFLCQHLGVAQEEGAYSRDKISDPTYKPPLRFRLAQSLQNGGRICRTLRYIPPVPPFSLTLNQSPKNIAGSDITNCLAHHWRQNIFGRPSDHQTNVCSVVPKRLADVISEVLNSKDFPCFMQIITYLADGYF